MTYKMTIRCLFRTLLLVLGLMIFLPGKSQPYAIPDGASGFAKNVRGAYAGSDNPTILYVDRLTDDTGNNGSNKGSFRWCLQQTYPRIILFEVSGYINLESYILVTSDYVSIYGQTAPDPGITISGVNVVDLRCNYLVMQHLRFRSKYVGDAQLDALTIYQGSNVFIDHCSFSYAEDECLGVSGVYGTFTGPLTVQNCIFYQGLNYNESKAILAGGPFDSLSIVKTAFVHCGLRTPLCGDYNYTAYESVNTLSYNNHYWGPVFEKSNDARLSFIGNEWRPGPNSNVNRQREVIRINSAMSPGSLFYLYDNYSLARVGAGEWDGVASFQDETKDSSDFYQATPFPGYETNAYPCSALDDSLMANAGARPWDRDSVDKIALHDMVNLTGGWITNQSEAFYPELAENKITLEPPPSPHADFGNGYTNLEMWVYYITKGISLSTATRKQEAYTLYPNPASDFIRIKGLGINSRIRVYNLTGQVLLDTTTDSNDLEISLSEFNPGMYLVKTDRNGELYASKIIKQN